MLEKMLIPYNPKSGRQQRVRHPNPGPPDSSRANPRTNSRTGGPVTAVRVQR